MNTWNQLLAIVLNISSLIVFCIVTAGLIVFSSSDLFLRLKVRLRLIKDSLPPFLVFISSVVSIVVGSIIVIASRTWTTRSALLDIPKPYIPINNEDVTKSVYDLIQTGFLNTCSVRLAVKPLKEDLKELGLGVEHPIDGVHLKASALQTRVVLGTLSVYSRIYDNWCFASFKKTSCHDFT
jgi:hypothetical protein